jgi:hypothetical protein
MEHHQFKVGEHVFAEQGSLRHGIRRRLRTHATDAGDSSRVAIPHQAKHRMARTERGSASAAKRRVQSTDFNFLTSACDYSCTRAIERWENEGGAALPGSGRALDERAQLAAPDGRIPVCRRARNQKRPSTGLGFVRRTVPFAIAPTQSLHSFTPNQRREAFARNAAEDQWFRVTCGTRNETLADRVTTATKRDRPTIIPFIVGELIVQLEMFDALAEWDDTETDLQAEIHDLSGGALHPGVFSQLEDETTHLLDLGRRVH